MDENAAVHHSLTQQAGHRPHGGLVAWHSISVLRFADGVVRATYNHLDMAQRKLIAEALNEPGEGELAVPWHVTALLTAAEELQARVTGDWGV